MATVSVAVDKAEYLVGEEIVATVAVEGADPGSQKTVSVYSVATVDGVVIQSTPVQFSVLDPPDEVVVTQVTSSDPLVVFAVDPADQFRWTSVAA